MEPKISLKQKILDHLQASYPRFLNGGEIEDFIRKTEGRKASNASRRCRELVEEEKINRKLEKGTVWYQFKPLTVFNTQLYSPSYIRMKAGQKQAKLI